MEGAQPNRYGDEGESLLTLRLNNQNYLTCPLYGKSFLLCRCCQRFDFRSDMKHFILSFKQHLRTLSCFSFEEIKDNIEEYLKSVEEQRQSNDYWTPLSLDTVFEIPAHISIMDGTLCRFCHQLRSEKIKNRCCEAMVKFKVKVYASNDSRRRMNVVLHSIVDNSLATKDYLDKAYNRKQHKDRIQDLENQILCLKTDKAILNHENKLLRNKHGVTDVGGDLSQGIVPLPSVESFLENIETARAFYNQVSNPNLLVDNGDLIRSILNLPRNLSNDDLLILHQSFRGLEYYQGQILSKLSLALMQMINESVDGNKGPVASRITGVCSSRAEDFNGRPFSPITSTSLRKYNQVFARPFLVFIYRSDADFKNDVDDLDSFFLSNSDEDDRKLHFSRMLRNVTMHLTRILQDHTRTNSCFKFIQAASVIAKTNENSRNNSPGLPEDEDDEDEILVGEEVDIEDVFIFSQASELEVRATTSSNVTFCKPSTLNVLLSAARYFCFGIVLISWDASLPIDEHLKVFRVGMIFHQIASLLHQVQSRAEHIQSQNHSISLDKDKDSKIYILTTMEGSVDLLKFRQAFLKLFVKLNTQFEILFTNSNADEATTSHCRQILANLLNPSATLHKKDFEITTANNEPCLRGSGFETLNYIVEEAKVISGLPKVSWPGDQIWILICCIVLDYLRHISH